jgi:hypothetical protein
MPHLGPVSPFTLSTLGSDLISVLEPPIVALLLSSHVYWNLDGYAGGNATDAVKEWELVMPYADQVVATDTIRE